jgi:tRNA pseudouridine55 synthase
MDSELLSGFLLIDKPKDITSFDVIRKLRKQTGIRTFGHAGTLDPFATGLLIIAVNKYTRLLALLDNAEKEYTATMVLGTATSTGDPEGDIIQTIVRQITLDEIEMATQKVLNIQALKPPLHSAIKVNGKKAYERARADEDFELPERASAIFSFTVDKFEFPCLTYSCRVSKGTYIRSLSQWIAETLGTVAYTSELRRTAIGSVSVQKASQLSEITDTTFNSHVITVLDILPEMESLTLDEDGLKRIKNGNSIDNAGADNGEILLFDKQSNCLGLSFRKENVLYPKVNL